jgi:hypothetical protein
MERLKDMIEKEITQCMEQILDFCSIACPEPNWRALRSKILRSSNNAIRNIKLFVDENYKEK